MLDHFAVVAAWEDLADVLIRRYEGVANRLVTYLARDSIRPRRDDARQMGRNRPGCCRIARAWRAFDGSVNERRLDGTTPPDGSFLAIWPQPPPPKDSAPCNGTSCRSAAQTPWPVPVSRPYPADASRLQDGKHVLQLGDHLPDHEALPVFGPVSHPHRTVSASPRRWCSPDRRARLGYASRAGCHAPGSSVGCRAS